MVLPQQQGLYDPANEHDACGVGFVVNIKNRKSHAIIEQGLQILKNLEHRGATGYDPLLGDGAGILIQIPHTFLAQECQVAGFSLPEPGNYAVGHIFLPRDPRLNAHCERVWARCLKEQGLKLLGWRTVPVDNSSLSKQMASTEPFHRQVFIARRADSALFPTRAPSKEDPPCPHRACAGSPVPDAHAALTQHSSPPR